MSAEERVAELAAEVEPVDEEAARQARRHHDRLLKPPGSLGQLEQLGAQLAAIAGSCPPPVPAEPAVLVAAGDHGVHARGVTPWPQQITAAMVEQFCAGRAAVSVLADVVGARVSVLDVGVAHPIGDHPRLRRARIRDGTADLSAEPAMTREQAARAAGRSRDHRGARCGAAERLPVILDGVVSNTAALVAAALCPQMPGYLVAGHRSPEPAAAAALDHLGLGPLLDLQLRLGEGTGALAPPRSRLPHSCASPC